VKRAVFVIVAVLLSTAYARVLYVHPDSALNSIQAALDSCAADDTVLVGPGTYVENLVWPATQGIDLVSEAGSAVTVIDGDSAGRVISITSGVDSTTRIAGFTVTNGFLWGESGAGILCLGSSPFLSGNVVSGNLGQLGCGGGIYCDGATTRQYVVGNRIEYNVVEGGMSAFGGGIYCSGTPVVLVGNEITRNSAGLAMYAAGGGIWVSGCSSCVISSNIITLNEGGYGAGIEWLNCSGEVRGNVIHGNVGSAGIRFVGTGAAMSHDTVRANAGVGVMCGLMYDGFGSARIDSCVVDSNGAGGIECTQSDDRVVVRHCSIEHNVHFGFCAWYADSASDLRENWWGHSTGPYHATLNPGGLGDTVIGHAQIEPWLEEPLGIHGRARARLRVTTLPATLVRDVLVLEGRQAKDEGGAVLLDAAGRRAMDLAPGANDVRHLSPGVYFVRSEPSAVGRQPSAIVKVIVTR